MSWLQWTTIGAEHRVGLLVSCGADTCSVLEARGRLVPIDQGSLQVVHLRKSAGGAQ